MPSVLLQGNRIEPERTMTASPTSIEEFHVQGMSCQHCVRAVTTAIHQQDASAQVEIDLARGKVQVRSGLPRERLAAVIRDEGYTVQA